MDLLERFTKYLESYNGRDKILRTLSYTTKCAAGLVKNADTSKRLDNFSSQISAARAALRLLDDIPMIVYVIEYGLGNKESDAYVRYANLVSNMVDVMFYPADHIAWAIDHKVVPWTSTRFATASTVFWVVSLYLTLAKSVRTMAVITQLKSELRGDDEETRDKMKNLISQQKKSLISAIRSFADLIFAVHYLPEGYLWSGTLKKWHVGALGSLSSILGLYQSCS